MVWQFWGRSLEVAVEADGGIVVSGLADGQSCRPAMGDVGFLAAVSGLPLRWEIHDGTSDRFAETFRAKGRPVPTVGPNGVCSITAYDEVVYVTCGMAPSAFERLVRAVEAHAASPNAAGFRAVAPFAGLRQAMSDGAQPSTSEFLDDHRPCVAQEAIRFRFDYRMADRIGEAAESSLPAPAPANSSEEPRMAAPAMVWNRLRSMVVAPVAADADPMPVPQPAAERPDEPRPDELRADELRPLTPPPGFEGRKRRWF